MQDFVLLSFLLHDQLRLENAASFGQGNKEFGQGKVNEKSGDFTFFDVWKPCFGNFSIHNNKFSFAGFGALVEVSKNNLVNLQSFTYI